MDSEASTSGCRKRKRCISDDSDESDDDFTNTDFQTAGVNNIPGLVKGGHLFSEPIDNEYEDLDEDLDENEEQEANNLKKEEYDRILKAQEPATISQYGDIKITPFNLTEELEEGEFDKAGNFFPSKDKSGDEEENDNWADSIDWAAIERDESKKSDDKKSPESVPKKSTNDQNPPDTERIDWLTSYKQMLRIMRPDETVQKTIRRLGNIVPKRRFIKSKASESKDCPMEADVLADVAEAKKKLDLMIELAHQRLEDGDTDIYQKSFEDLEEAIN